MVFLSSCCSVGSRLNSATLINEGLFKNGSNPLKNSDLIPETCPQAYSPHLDWALQCLKKCSWQTYQHCVDASLHILIALNYCYCTELSSGLVSCLNWRSCLELGPALLTFVKLSLSPTQCHPESDTVVRLIPQLISRIVFLTFQKQLLHHLPLWLSWNILHILWFVQNTVSRMFSLPVQTWWVIPAQRGMHRFPFKQNILILKLLWWFGKRCTNWDQYIYQSSALCVRAANVSGY